MIIFKIIVSVFLIVGENENEGNHARKNCITLDCATACRGCSSGKDKRLFNVGQIQLGQRDYNFIE